MVRERKTKDFQSYESGILGQGYINVYLPREDGNFIPRHVPPPSPVFDVDTVYKFSDQVHHDRHLFLSTKKGYFRNYADDEDVDSLSNRSSLADSGYQSINVVKLNVDASAKSNNGIRGSRRPLNERLSAYVQKRKQPQKEPERTLTSPSGRSVTSETGSTSSTPKPKLLGLGLRRSKTISFHNGNFKSGDSIEKLPQLGPSKTFTRDSTNLRRQNTLLVSGGGFKMPKSLTSLPLRAQSKPVNIYRQSTDIYEKRNAHKLELFSPSNMTLKINSLKPTGLTPGYLMRQKTSVSNAF